ncbi:hypothetical protein [Limimaricola hongkongensis]|uniref:Uncharacterized protein n=1 Tax=Limimaricola hongkongensis DSM 17492 TaxID=1122180 RepID=A0A017HB73_9RHOB|nr:hypothetical protein [Limimaricola hongkongensis]EYD71616.1 hypothetical protein Lokhon_01683 [Limimaricola hongkongensis DSM 17492]
MADRARSKDGVKETDAYVSDEDKAGAGSQPGREGGDLTRKVGTRDDLKRAEQDDPGATRVRKSDEKDDD